MSSQVLAPLSLLAIVLILAGLGAVVVASADKFGQGKDVEAYIPETLPIFIGMAIYSFEGIGLAVPIQNSMKQPEHFPFVWILSSVLPRTLLGSLKSLLASKVNLPLFGTSLPNFSGRESTCPQ